MEQADLERIFQRIEEHCTLTKGLSDAEVEEVEAKYRFRFPPDLRALLQFRLPVSDRFPDWRNEDFERMQLRLADPLEGVLGDIGYGFWFGGWGERPADTIQAMQLAFSQIENVPLLIPVYGSRFLPAAPCVAGNPVFSVVQSDVIYYGFDLKSYFDTEFPLTFGRPDVSGFKARARHIDFWSHLAALNS